MNKSELIKTLSDKSMISPEEASLIVNIVFDSMKATLQDGGRVEIRGLGSFKLKNYPGYTGRNPKTGKAVSVLPKRLPFFRAGKDFKAFLNT